MKKALLLSVSFGIAAFSQAQLAIDDASNAVYVVGQEYIQVGTPPGDQTAATNGLNGGFGFNRWQRGGYGSSTNHGTTLITNVDSSFKMGSKQFGLRSAPDGFEGADARRRLDADLEVGSVISFAIMPGGNGAGTQNTHGDMGAEIRSMNLGANRDMYVINGSNGQNYSIGDAAGSQFSNIPVTPGVRVDIAIITTGLGTATINLTPWGGSTSSYNVVSISAGQKIRTVQFYSFETNGDFYANFLRAGPVQPTGYNVLEGVEFEGGLGGLFASDDLYLSVFNDETSLIASVEAFSSVVTTSPTSYTVQIETSVNRPGLAQAVAVYNYQTNGYQAVGGGVAPISDTTQTITLTSNPANLVGGNGQVKAKITWSPVNDEDPAQDGWLQNIDQISWMVS